MTVTEPLPSDPDWPRYSTRPFPPYRFIPGHRPHPRRNVHGHSYGQPEPKPAGLSAKHWQKSEAYLYGIDLYNFAYWWESHEIFEGFWRAAGHDTEQRQFFQALIQLAAANLKHFLTHTTTAHNLLERGIARLQRLPPSYMGIDVAGLADAVHRRMADACLQAPLIGLDMK